MSVNSALVQGGSLRLLMDEIEALEHTLNDALVAAKAADLVPEELPLLTVYRWRPGAIEPPAVYNLISPSPFEQVDQLRWRDTLNILVRIAVPYGNDYAEMDYLEPYSDLFRQQVDPLLTGPANASVRPFNGAAQWAERTDMRSVTDTFNDIPYACVEFVIQTRLDRMINPT